MSDAKRFRYFIRNPESGEPWFYCGTPDDETLSGDAIKDFVLSEIGNMFGDDTFTVEVCRHEMTDAEVAALSEE